MSKEVEVIFKEEKKGQFKIGQRKKVKLGYAINYLLPQKLAVLVSSENMTYIEKIKDQAKVHEETLKKKAEAVKTEIDGKTIVFKHKVHDEVKLYGSVSSADIAKELNAVFKVEVDRYDIRLAIPIKVIGEYTVGVNIHAEVNIAIKVDVQAEKEKPKDAKKSTKTKK
tara:strand:- start:62 stop:565 length:504 start_codon:yes stop_codon:yes gene_type:complete